MKLLNVYRNGEKKLSIPAEVRNGVLRAGKNILINSDLIRSPWTPATVAAAIKSGKITPEIEAMGMRPGDNGNGLICRWAADEAAEKTAKLEAAYNAMPPEKRAEIEERNAIDRLYCAARRSEHHDEDDNQMMRAMQQRAEADRRLAAWRAKYPEAAAAERREKLLEQAEEQKRLAVGALTYDADGALSPAMQQERHDELMARAAELTKQAEARGDR